MTKQNVFAGDSFRLLGCTEVIDKVENFLRIFAVNADCFQVPLGESEKHCQVNLKGIREQVKLQRLRFHLMSPPLLVRKSATDT